MQNNEFISNGNEIIIQELRDRVKSLEIENSQIKSELIEYRIKYEQDSRALKCLYRFNELLKISGNSFDEMASNLCDIMSDYLQPEKNACFRIVIGDTEYRTENFVESENRYIDDIVAHENKIGFAEICYLGENFHELSLMANWIVDVITGVLKRIIERQKSKMDLFESEKRFLWNAKINEALATLYEPLISSESVEEIADCVLTQAQKLTESRHGYVSTIDPNTDDGTAYILATMVDDLHNMSEDDKSILFSKGRDGLYGGLWGHSLNTGEGFFTNNPFSHISSKGTLKGHIPLKNFLSMPVMLDGEIVGQIALANSNRDYTNDDLIAIKHLAQYYTLAIQRKRIEEKSEESKTRYHNIIAQANGVAYQRDWDKNAYVFIDEGIKKITGYSSEEITPDIFDSLIVEEIGFTQGNKPHRSDISIQIGGDNATVYRADYRLRSLDGQIVWISDSSIQIRDKDGRLVGALGMIQDITERIQREEEIMMLGQLLDITPASITVHDANGKFLYANQKTFDLHGFSKDEFMNMNLHSIDVPESEKLIVQRINELTSKGEASFDVEHFRKDGSKVPLNVHAKLLEWNGQSMIMSVAIDISELLMTEKALRKSEEKYRQIVETTQEGIWAMDGNMLSTFVNQAMADMLFYSIEEMIGKPVNYFMFEDDLVDHTQKMQSRIQGKDEQYERKFRRKDGSTCWAIVSAKALKDDFGNFAGSFAMFTDITERKRIEEILRAKDRDFRTLVENIPGAVYRFDPKNIGKMDYMSDGILEISGISASKFMSGEINYSDIIIPENSHNVYQTVDEKIKNRLPYEIEYQIRHTDGVPRWILERGSATYGVDGEVLYLNGVIVDITTLKSTEQALRESESKYKTLIDGSPDTIMQFDRNLRYLYVSPSITKYTGILAQKCIGKTHRDLGYDENICKYWKKAIHNVLNTGKYHEETLTYDSKIGTVTFNWRLLPEFDQNGNVISVLSILRDITEHRNIEKNYQYIFDSMINGVAMHEIICNEMGHPIDYRFIDINPAFEQITGLKREFTIGRTAKEILPDLEPYWIDIYGQVALTGNPNHFEQFTRTFNKYFEVTAYSPRKGQFVSVFADITDRKHAEEIQARLQQASKLESIGRLAGGVAHDFNNLLTVIQGSTSLAMIGLSQNDPLLGRLKMIDQASDRATQLTRQLLAFSRKQIIEPKVINLNNLVENIRKMLIRLIGEDIDLQIFLDENISMINADAGQIEQVIVNLAVNSRDAMPDGGKLTIETSNTEVNAEFCANHPSFQSGKYVLMIIADTGHGMDDEIKKHIFEPFFTTKKQEIGTGLGLATVYGIVKQHNGFIDCYSEVGHGTLFKIYLPSVEKKEEHIDKEPDLVEIMTGRETILLVEDEDSVREMTNEFLKHLGYDVLVAQNGGMALLMVEQ